MTISGFQRELMSEKGGAWTVQEIFQQPRLWKETWKRVRSKQKALADFFEKSGVLENGEVILTGAGSSEFVGASLLPFLEESLSIRCRCVGSTDLIPRQGVKTEPGRPVLLVSFARSGDSPESLGAVEAQQTRGQTFHLVITCNQDGALAKWAKEQKNGFLLCLPKETNDQGFAMTSSFSCMLLAAALCFQLDRLEELEAEIDEAARAAERILEESGPRLKELVEKRDFERAVYLGFGEWKGLAKEAALKMLELSSGKTASLYDTPLGFRHGPKSFLNPKTLIVLFVSGEKERWLYERDLIHELTREGRSENIVIVTALAHDELLPNVICLGQTTLPRWLLGLPYLVVAQLLALFQSFHLGVAPDDPCVSKEVNRVVQGVTIYRFE